MPRLDERFLNAVYAVTKLIPKGQVATYGQIATYVVSPRYARAVGTALKALPRALSKDVPWHRVINAAGRVSARGEVERPTLQMRRLLAEGIRFDRAGKTDLRVFGWTGPGPKWRMPLPDPKPERVQRRVGPAATQVTPRKKAPVQRRRRD